MQELSFADVCARTLALFVVDEVPLAELREMAAGAYVESAFHHQPTLPLKVLAGRLCVLETFHGPTASFKVLIVHATCISHARSYHITRCWIPAAHLMPSTTGAARRACRTWACGWWHA